MFWVIISCGSTEGVLVELDDEKLDDIGAPKALLL
jgi:hypothetical protein